MMSRISYVNKRTSNIWIALKRLEKNDDRLWNLHEVPILEGVDAAVVKKIVSTAFGLNPDNAILKIRNQNGCLMPLNCSILPNSKHTPYVLEVVKIFQHVCPKPRTIGNNVINKSLKNRLQSIDRKIQRVEDLLPDIKLRHNERLNQEIESLVQKLMFLHKRMQVADSHCWRGVLTRSPLW
ncbi:unnamed protein product [Boreogadus saida]